MSMKKLAIFDVDWTIIKPNEGRTFPKNVDDWQWLYESVPDTLEYYSNEGYTIVFLTDQSKVWKIDMINNIKTYFTFEPIVIISTSKETNKPNPELFYTYFKGKYSKKNSFYVGDALNREGDWSGVDKELAINIGIQYYSPEEIFEFKTGEECYEYYIKNVEHKEIIIMVGYQGSGKSTLASSFDEEKYHVISGDIFKTPEKMIKEASKYIKTKSIIFDATNGTIEKRNKYIQFAQKYKLPCRCIWLNVTIDVAIQRIAIRFHNGGNYVSKIALYKLRKSFEEPTPDEGFELIVV